MMNLLIGLLSEKLAEVLEDREKIEYQELADLILMLERILPTR
jgi:hypothetical protein